MTLDGNVTGVNDFVVSSHVHSNVTSSDGGEESRADFQVAVWMWAPQTLSSNASVVGGRVFSYGAVVTFALLIFRDRAFSRTSNVFAVFLLT